MPNAFEKGDVVVLKSGGPPMTVEHVPGEQHDYGTYKDYVCRWFKGATLDRGHFDEILLAKYEPPAKSK